MTFRYFQQQQLFAMYPPSNYSCSAFSCNNVNIHILLMTWRFSCCCLSTLSHLPSMTNPEFEMNRGMLSLSADWFKLWINLSKFKMLYQSKIQLEVQIDLSNLYVLFSQCRSCDNTLGKCFFQISSSSRAYLWKDKVSNFPMTSVH